jgi:hypothetical protein
VPRIGCELTVGGMVHRFDSDDLRYERVIVLVNVLDEFELRGRRSDHENLVRSLQRKRNVAIEVLAVGGVTLFGGDRRPAVQLPMGIAKRLFLEGLAIDLKDLGFLVIDPNGGMANRHGNLRVTVPVA